MQMQTLADEISEKIEKAAAGREIWLELINREKIENGDYVILFPSAYDEWAHYGALYMDKFLEAKAARRGIALYCDWRVKKSVSEHSRKAEAIRITEDEADKITAFYSLYMFTDNLVIFSSDKPNGRNGSAIVGVNGVTAEEVAAIGIYGLKGINADE